METRNKVASPRHKPTSIVGEVIGKAITAGKLTVSRRVEKLARERYPDEAAATDKTREGRLRRNLARDGYRLQKNSRRADFGGYQIVDEMNIMAAGWADDQRGYGLDLAGAELWAGLPPQKHREMKRLRAQVGERETFVDAAGRLRPVHSESGMA